MDFEQADKLHWQILKLIWRNVDRSKPTSYKVSTMAPVQENILEALATGQYVLLLADGEIKAFGSWWWLDDDGLSAIKEGMKPHTRHRGEHLFITEATACDGWMLKLVRSIRNATGKRYGSWYRPKNGKWFEGSNYGLR
jgi:hemolysin-activating ACP:hemolysin acyltransferase